MTELLTSGIFLRALLAGLFLALACGLLGVFLVLRKEAMIGHGLAHVAFSGLALGFILNFMPLAISLVVCLLGAILILEIREHGSLYGDTALGIISSAGLALGILLVSLKRGFGVELMSFLFGDILAISSGEVWFSGVLALVVVILLKINYQALIFMTFDRETALVSGVRVKRLERMLVLLTAMTVVLGLKLVGILLVTALLVIPASASLQVAQSFKKTLLISTLFSFVSIISGIFLSYWLDTPAAAMIVFVALLLFVGALISKKKKLIF
ncbi:MAG: metal ABC transporter permease [Candidatus Aminicenantes bacterium]|nr:metal ABC transporter permease [Candidatus Aminicenantes bacterium]